MADQDDDRTEEATPQKLREARNRGAVARSADLTTLAMLAAITLALHVVAWRGLSQALATQRRIIGHIGTRQWQVDAVAAWLGQLLLELLALLAPWCLILATTAIVASRMQVGAVFTIEPLKPDLQRLNLVAGLRRLLTLRTVFDLGKAIVKTLVLGAIAYHAIWNVLPGIVGLTGADPGQHVRAMLNLCAALLAKLVLAMLLIGGADFAYARYEFGKRMRMSKREVKDEHKRREGDPRIRARIFRLRREMLKRSAALGKVRSADVLITNPTRLAVALKYQHGSSAAPMLVAKGAGDIAARMRKLAARHGIPVVQNRALARTMFYEVDHDAYVPEKLYPQLARIMIWVYSLRDAKRASER